MINSGLFSSLYFTPNACFTRLLAKYTQKFSGKIAGDVKTLSLEL